MSCIQIGLMENVVAIKTEGEATFRTPLE